MAAMVMPPTMIPAAKRGSMVIFAVYAAQKDAIIIIGAITRISNKKASVKLEAAGPMGTPRRVLTIKTYTRVPIRAGNKSEKKFRTKTTINKASPPGLNPDNSNRMPYRQARK